MSSTSLQLKGEMRQSPFALEHGAEGLLSFSLELSSAQSLAQLSRIITARLAERFEAQAAVLALARGDQMRVIHLHSERAAIGTSAFRMTLQTGLSATFHSGTDRIAIVAASAILGGGLATTAGWEEILIAKLTGAGGDLLGVIALADPKKKASPDRAFLLQACNHVSIALENLRQIVQITQASRQWAEIFDAISDFLLVHDERYRVVRVNRTLAESRKRHPAELVGHSVSDIFPDRNAGLKCPFCLPADQSAARGEFLDPRTNRTYLLSSSPLAGIGEEGRQTIHILKDVTEHRQAERLYHELFDNLQEGAYFSTPEGRFLEVNQALVRMLGYGSKEELLTIDIPSRIYVSPDHKEILRQALSSRGSMKTKEVVLRRKDNSLVHALETGFAVHDERGNIRQLRGVVLDITEIKRVQAQLKRERDFNTQILNHTQSMIMVVDTAGLVSYANRKCFEVGARTGNGELVGNRLDGIVASTHRRTLQNAFENTLQGHQTNNLELPLVRDRELLGTFSANLSPMRDENGNVHSIVVVMTDITDMAMLQAKLVHAEKMSAVGQMVSGVAHEVNNPLAAIVGFSDLLLENPQLPESVHEDLKVIMQEAQRTREIIQNLLSFARQNPVQRQTVDINSVLRRTLMLRTYDFENRGIELTESFDDSLPHVEGDAHQLQQVFLNLLNNAYDAICESGRRGALTLRTLRVNGSVEISFRDNGLGITNIDRIFDPFFTTKEVGKGTGLGLSICYGIMREHGGEINCFNNPDGPGATFLLRLPIPAGARAMAAGAGQ